MSVIEITEGSILDDTADAICIPVNCVGVAGKGLALAARAEWPEWFAHYQRVCRLVAGPEKITPWTVDVWSRGKGRDVVAVPTKRHWRDRSSIDDIRRALDFLGGLAVKDGFGWRTIAVPPLGCGLGGLDWVVMRSLIVEKLGALKASRFEIKVRLYAPLETR